MSFPVRGRPNICAIYTNSCAALCSRVRVCQDRYTAWGY